MLATTHHYHNHHHHPCTGFKALCDAFTAVVGDCKPFSITGSLPCIRDLQDAGFDVQTLGGWAGSGFGGERGRNTSKDTRHVARVHTTYNSSDTLRLPDCLPA